MIRNYFRFLAVAALLALTVALLACGGSEEPAESAASSDAQPAATSPASSSESAAGSTAAAPQSAQPTTQAAADVPTAEPVGIVTGEDVVPSADLTFDDRPPQGGTLVRRWADPPTLDPHLAGDTTSAGIVNEVYGGLVTLSLNYEPVLDLAETASISEDGLTYTFVLRENAKFHDGKSVTAHDVKWSIERASDPVTLSTTAENYLGDIVGVEDKLAGNASEVSGVRVIDDRTVEFTIDAPKSFFLAKLSYPTAFVLDRDQVEGNDDWLEQPNGTGPFRLATYDVGELIILERNEFYHLGPPHLESVQMILSGGSAMIMYENDEIHLTGVGVDDLPRLLDPNDPLNPELHRSPQDFDVWYAGLNVAEPPFDDPKVRQALNYAVDLASIADNVYDGRVSPATGVIPPRLPVVHGEPAQLRIQPQPRHGTAAAIHLRRGAGQRRPSRASL